jgi:hypothetical protein
MEVVLKWMGTERFRLRRIDTVAMDKTVVLERKLMTLVFKPLATSISGFIKTPPPIPLIAPITEALKLMIKKSTIIQDSLFMLLLLKETPHFDAYRSNIQGVHFLRFG